MNNKSTICPLPITKENVIQLAHGSGGKQMHNLINKLFIEAFKNKFLEEKHDGAILDINNTNIAFTTDSYVVKPLFFPGGNIGKLAIDGTVNDLAMCGAKPLYLSVGMIIEEGFNMNDLKIIVESMKKEADIANVKLVTGDTKVVNKGKGDGLFINTAGIGVVEPNINISPKNIKPGDVIILNGDIGRHGIAIMSSREGIEFESKIESDCACLSGLVNELLKKVEIHCFRDLTRGGLGSALVELAETSNLHFEIQEEEIDISDEVKGACEILGLDPIYVANEGRFITIVPKGNAKNILSILQKDKLGSNAKIIGEVKNDHKQLVTLKSKFGTTRIIEMLSGEQLPRIC